MSNYSRRVQRQLGLIQVEVKADDLRRLKARLQGETLCDYIRGLINDDLEAGGESLLVDDRDVRGHKRAQAAREKAMAL